MRLGKLGKCTFFSLLLCCALITDSWKLAQSKREVLVRNERIIFFELDGLVWLEARSQILLCTDLVCTKLTRLLIVNDGFFNILSMYVSNLYITHALLSLAWQRVLIFCKNFSSYWVREGPLSCEWETKMGKIEKNFQKFILWSFEIHSFRCVFWCFHPSLENEITGLDFYIFRERL